MLVVAPEDGTYFVRIGDQGTVDEDYRFVLTVVPRFEINIFGDSDGDSSDSSGDRLVIDNSAATGGLVNETINYDGGSDLLDALSITGDPGAVVARETYQVGATQDAGTWVLDPDDSGGPGFAGTTNGDELVVNFSGLEPVDTDTPAAVFDILFGGGNDIAVVQDALGTLNGFQATQVVDVSGTFEDFAFARKDTVRFNGQDGADQFTLDQCQPGSRLGGQSGRRNIRGLRPRHHRDRCDRRWRRRPAAGS